MDQWNTSRHLLELLSQPAFLVKDGSIVHANRAAREQGIKEGRDVAEYLGEDSSAYRDFSGGSLHLTLSVGPLSCAGTVTRTEECDIFLLECDTPKLQALSLAAQQLRQSLQDMTVATEMVPSSQEEHQLRNANLKRAAHQMQRILGNMSDAARLCDPDSIRLEVTDLGSVFDELMEKLEPLCNAAGMQLRYTPLTQVVVGLANRELLIRAVCNLVSNAIKFSPKGSTLDARLSCSGNQLSFTLTDEGCGIAPEVMSSVFSRYRRQPGIEDSRHGLGLGLSVVRAVAAAHGGTVLLDHPEGKGTRITVTIAIRKPDISQVHTPVLLPRVDYTGGCDQTLIELADILPAKAFE